VKIARLSSPSDTPIVVVGVGVHWVCASSLGVKMTSAVDLDPVRLRALSDAARALSQSDLARLIREGAAFRCGQPGDAPGFEPKLLAPVPNPGKVVAVGLNYRDHIAEVEAKLAQHRVAFGKFASALIGPYDRVGVDFGVVTQLDYQVELGVVIGKTGRDLHRDAALDHVAGYVVANDVSCRSLQFSQTQRTPSKAVGFCPIGPWITTGDEVGDPQDLELWTKVNGEDRQRSDTRKMLFSVADVLAFCSRATTLHPGDLVLTGTPSGVAMGLPGRPWLRPGDIVECGITGLGSLRTEIIAASPTTVASTRVAS
jgi:2,4-didehydro-3-deoxy-L-rhamnonate hydrolase